MIDTSSDDSAGAIPDDPAAALFQTMAALSQVRGLQLVVPSRGLR
jgi:hypothetical protein